MYNSLHGAFKKNDNSFNADYDTFAHIPNGYFSQSRNIIKSYIEGKLNIHIHFIVGGFTDIPTCDYCAIFKHGSRHSKETNFMNAQNGSNDFEFSGDILQATEHESAMLVDEAEFVEKSDEGVITCLPYTKWLQPLNSLSCLVTHSSNLIKTATSGRVGGITPSLEEQSLVIKDGEFRPIKLASTLSNSQFSDRLVKTRTEIMENVTEDNRPSKRQVHNGMKDSNFLHGLEIWLLRDTISVSVGKSPYLTLKFLEVLFGTFDFYSASEKGGHVLQYPYGEENGKETKDSKGARDTRAHKGRVPRQSKEGNQVNAPKPEEVESQTSPDPRSGGYNAKHTHSGSLEDA